MINTKHLLKVSLSWINLTYLICFIAVAVYPPLRSQFMLYALHEQLNIGVSVLTVQTFIFGLIWWNIIATLGIYLFCLLYNKIKQ